MKLGRFIVDTHVHSQRHAAGAVLKGATDFTSLTLAMSEMEAYDNCARLLYDMECYGVDMCILQPTFGMTNETNLDQVRKHPDKFVANCQAGTKPTRDRFAAEGRQWTFQAALEELEDLLKTGNYVGIGEGMPFAGQPGPLGATTRFLDEEQTLKNMMEVCDLARKYRVPIRFHAGTPGGYGVAYHGYPSTYNPLWAHDLATAFPDLPIVLEHGGVQGGYSQIFYEQCLHVASGHKNVYLETGRYWSQLYYKPLSDPNIGAGKLLWGTDWGAGVPVYNSFGSGGLPASYSNQNLNEGIPRHQVDIWGWSLRQLQGLDISQDDLNLILGGNAVRIYNLRTPGGLTRMFKFVD